MPKENIHQVYMQIAKQIAKLSYCKRSQVGSIIVKDNNIISMGYNGTPFGFHTNDCETLDNKTKNEVLHSESNAITKCAKNGISCNEATLYITMSPCFDCSKLIIQAGIKVVYFLEKYRDNQGLEFLNSNKVETIHIQL